MRYINESMLNEVIYKVSGTVLANDGTDKNLKVFLSYLFWKKEEDSVGYRNDDFVQRVMNEVSSRIDRDVLEQILEEADYEKDSCVKLAVQQISDTRRYGKYGAEEACPASITDTVVELLEIKEGESICDFGCGSGKFLMGLSNYLREKGVEADLNGYEISTGKALVATCLLEMIGRKATIVPLDFIQGTDSRKFDKGFLFPPFGLRYALEDWERLSSGYAGAFSTRSETELLFVLKALERLKDGGKLIALLPSNVSSRASGEKTRTYLYERGLVEGIVSLPGGLLDGTLIPVDLWILTKTEKEGIKFLDATGLKEQGRTPREITLKTEEILQKYNNGEVVIVSDEEVKSHNYSFSCGVYNVLEGLEKLPNPVYLRDVCQIMIGSQYTAAKFKDKMSDTPTTYQILTSMDIQDGIVDYDSLQYIREDEKLLKFKLEEGDLVVTTKSTVVKTFVATDVGGRNIIVTGGMIILRPDNSKLNSTYLKMFLDSEIGKSELSALSKGAIITTISLKDFEREMVIPCPAVDKQNELADDYNQLLWMISSMSKRVNEMKEQLGAMFDESVKEE